MKQHYVMPVGVDDFKRVREEYYYVDKTDFIKALIDGHAQATLLTRPRRFGKTLAMSMLYYFFTLENARENRRLFEGCKIERAGEKYMALQGTRPVIFLILKDIKQATFPEMLKSFSTVMQEAYRAHAYLQKGDLLDEYEKDYFKTIMSRQADSVDLQISLKNLMVWLQRYHQKPVVVLMDEYDAPIQTAWDYGYYDQAIIFMRNYMSNALKSNQSLDFAVITGVLRIVKESIFSSLNNLDVSSVASGAHADAVGFTHDEIAGIAADWGCQKKMDQIKEWYDGYNFVGQEIYNPWSVISYFRHNCRPDTYWVNTSGNTILRHLLENASREQSEQLTALIHGKKIGTVLNEGVIYRDIYKNTSALNTLLLTTGYLTMVDYPVPGELVKDCTLRIPNKEVRVLFQQEIMKYLESSISCPDLLIQLAKALLSGDTAAFAEGLETFLRRMASFYDTANRESFYHGLVLGLLAVLLPKYEVVSNRESGCGRFDLAIYPAKGQDTGVIMEFKVADSEASLEEKAREALSQIEEKDYLAEFTQRGVGSVWQYGISFWGKKCHVSAKAS